MLRTSASVSRDGARPAYDRVVEHRSNASRAAARLPNSRCARIRACHAPSCSPVDCQQSLGRRNPRLRLALGGEHCLSHRQRELRHPLTLFLKPAVECRVQTIEIIKQGGPKHLQPSRIGHGRPGDHANIDPEAFVGQDQVIAVRLQQGTGTRTQCTLQFVHRLPQRSPRLFPGALAPEQPGQSGCAVPALVLPVPAPPARPWSCATAAECSARMRPAPASGRTASGATAGRQWPYRGRRSAGWISELR